MSRQSALALARSHFDSGDFLSTLSRRVAIATESQRADAAPLLRRYLSDEIAGALAALGFTCEIMENPVPGMPPFLIGERIESPARPTVLLYGHGDVIDGDAANWTNERSPWQVRVEGERWYGRGIADNKAQHSINLAALSAVFAERGELGFNAKIVFEMGEEVGSPGLGAICANLRERLSADLLIASDGPRQRAASPTVFLGSRGALHFRLRVANAFGARHSGNWGGVLANPATVLANALASLVDGHGRIRVNGLLPPPIPPQVRERVAHLQVGSDEGDPPLSANWGEPGLTPAERVFAWNTLEVLAMQAGNVTNPVSAIPRAAEAVCQLRFVVGTDWRRAKELIEAHLAREGYKDIEVTIEASGNATRLDPNDPWVAFTERSIEASTGKPVTLLPNLGGTIPNECFADTLGLATIWIPHSYPGCRQHAPDEHVLAPVMQEALQLMTGVFWDLGEPDVPHAG
ncbi:M20 family metallopeptidase [Paraburkholderia phenoliruptrix]|uniref:M20 family metallopeptidase n=1 Tax=Paraburkholderia phenoliruptrix TaxID=252970 RepID=A0ABV3WF47_9BURK|nr:M20 family metallopeptidase [Paraburkholderia phenoliruptrix]MDR6391031.1 acetylornithine deacetylase/succinyl-diaminopimelate desuccinylase-like protein [Paraburkholderia phenoliruptrix]